jgi:hypothetical protein
MSYEITDAIPPPEPQIGLKGHLEALEPGMSLFTRDHTIRVARVTASALKTKHPGRDYKVAGDNDGVRIWRTM